MRQAILLALITPSARACFDETRGGCFTAGFVDNLSSAEDCQAACAFDSACNYFAYHSARGWTNEPCEPGDAGYECTAA